MPADAARWTMSFMPSVALVLALSSCAAPEGNTGARESGGAPVAGASGSSGSSPGGVSGAGTGGIWGYVVGSTWRTNTGLMSSSGQARPALVWLMDFLGR